MTGITSQRTLQHHIRMKNAQNNLIICVHTFHKSFTCVVLDNSISKEISHAMSSLKSTFPSSIFGDGHVRLYHKIQYIYIKYQTT